MLALAWTGLVAVAALHGWGRQPLAGPEPAAFVTAVIEASRDHPGNLALVLLENDRIAGAHFASPGPPVDSGTRFQVASLSKWVTAWGVMTLVEAGRLDLDAPVETYLTRWRLPPGDHDHRGVTIRRLLGHTAGLTDGLGYLGFAPGRRVQTLEASLTRAEDAASGRSGEVRVGRAPGSTWRYSGGGYTLLQLAIEEVSGEPFAAYMQRAVLRPLGMARSTFGPVRDADLAAFYDADGSRAPHFRYTATGAASLYTSAADLTRFLQAHRPGDGGEAAGRGVLSPATLATMRRPHATLLGRDFWGLGLALYAPNGAGGHIIGHDGGNVPAINTAVRLDPATGDGIVVLATGDIGLASRLADEWLFWRTGEAGLPVMRILRFAGAGSAIILLLGALLTWRASRKT